MKNHNRLILVIVLWVLTTALPASAQKDLFAGLEHLFTVPKSYVAPFVHKAPIVDGELSDAAWQAASWAEDFEDIEGNKKPRPAHLTRIKMVWDDSCLYVAAQLDEPHVWGTLKEHDAIIYYDNDFEVFLDPDGDTHQYFEVEINALNTILDLYLAKPYRNGSGALLSYDVAGLRSAVRVQGTLNNPADRDSSWTLEMALPFRSLFIGNRWTAPKEGAIWRINFSRVQWDTEVQDGTYAVRTNERGSRLPEHNWVWSPQGVINMHYPERWGYLLFTRQPTREVAFSLPYEERQKQYLWLVYYRQKHHRGQLGQYATSLRQLGLSSPDVNVEGRSNRLHLDATRYQFAVSIQDGERTWWLNDEGLVRPSPPPNMK